jgi:CRISPR-associated protein Cas2
MYVILVYDVNVTRVSRVLKVGRRYLTWVQNSVLEGELTWAQLEKLKGELKKAMDEEEDSVLLYVLRTDKWLQREQLGKPKGEPEWMV